jgi:hypothetical protein
MEVDDWRQRNEWGKSKTVVVVCFLFWFLVFFSKREEGETDGEVPSWYLIRKAKSTREIEVE